MTQSHIHSSINPSTVMRMNTFDDARLVNLLGAVATGLTDQVEAACTEAAQLAGAAPEALIVMLDFSPDGSVHTLSQAVGLTHSGAVRLVDRLVEAGWATRRPGDDARSVKISLTRRGRTVAERVRSRRSDELASALAGLTARQRHDLMQACEVVVANLTRRRLDQRAAGAQPAGGALCRMCDFAACGRPSGMCPAHQVAVASMR
jgi:MarR family transcriptional regulator, negative regulator of the multidrug operon emrRAB